MILNKEQIKLVTQLLGNRIAELKRQTGLDEVFEIKRKHHKYLVAELELAESMLDEIIDKKSHFKKGLDFQEWIRVNNFNYHNVKTKTYFSNEVGDIYDIVSLAESFKQYELDNL